MEEFDNAILKVQQIFFFSLLYLTPFMCFHVLKQSLILKEAFSTLFAIKGSITRVGRYVSLQMFVSWKCFTACITVVRFIPRMDHHVSTQVFVAQEIATTFIACVWPVSSVDHLMTIEMVILRKEFATYITSVVTDRCLNFLWDLLLLGY